jgi:F-type H+-transporting ATPase subunit b
MGLLIPEFGLVIWMLLAFGIVLFILAKFAWKPILKSLKDREQSIEEAINSAKKAREEVATLHADNQKIIAEARLERDVMLKEAREVKDSIISEAREKAQGEAIKIMESSRIALQNEKMLAINDLKNQITNISIEIASKVLERELKNPEDHKEYVNKLLKEINLN